MDEKDKDLLLKDICGRLPYGVKTPYSGFEMTIRGVDVESKTVDVIDWGKARFAAVRIEKIKPYLRQMSSMTEEEERFISEKFNADKWASIETYSSSEDGIAEVFIEDIHGFVDWLDKNMFDYRGLIRKGLALEAKEGMYNNN